MNIEQTENGIELIKSFEDENLFDSMEKLGKELERKYPILAQLADFIKFDFSNIEVEE